jgi:hypothetical protein
MSQPILFIVAWICSSFCSLLLVPADVKLDHDEIYWIGSAYYYELAFEQRDWTHPAWGLLPARENPPVSKYVLGLGLALAGHHVTTMDNLSYFYLVWLQWEKNPEAQATGLDGQKRALVVDAATPGFRQSLLENLRAPLTSPVVRAARNTSMVCAVLASLLLFLLGFSGGQGLGALIASQLLLIHPAVVSASSHGMSDTVALMFSIAAALAVFWWYRFFSSSDRKGLGHGISVSLMTGVLLALACGAKMNSLVIVLVAAVVGTSVMLRKWIQRDRRGAIVAAAHMTLTGAFALAVFIIINPAILQDVPGGLAATVQEHRRTEDLHTDHARTHMTNLPDKLNAVVSLAFLGWPSFIAMVAIVIWSAVKHWRDDGIRFAICWWLVAFVCVTAWIPFLWPRYIIPLLPPTVWLLGNAASVKLHWVVGYVREHRRRRTAGFTSQSARSCFAGDGT